MTSAEYKKALVMECTCDRLHWKVARLRRKRQARLSLAGGEVAAWVHRIHHVAGPWLPRWWRLGYAAFRAVRRSG